MSGVFPPSGFHTLPIIFVSTHGVYDLTVEPTPFVVPPNTYIFETQTIGDLCMTPIDKPLWDLMNNRDAFIRYFAGAGDLALAKRISESGIYGRNNINTEDTKVELKHRDYKRVFQNMHFYQPGDTIYNRTLMIGGGRNGARRSYANMGFYSFVAGRPVDRYPDGPASRIRELQPLRTKLIGDRDLTTSQKELIGLMGIGAIYIFSSCGAIWKDSNTGKVPPIILDRRIKQIETVQHNQDLTLMRLTPAGPSGYGGNNNMDDGSLPGRESRSRAAKKATSTYTPVVHEQDRDPFFMNNDPDFESRDPQFTSDYTSAADGPSTTHAPAGTIGVFVKTADGVYRQIPTPYSSGSAQPNLFYTARNLRDARKAYAGQVLYGYDSTRGFYLLGGGGGGGRGSTRRGRIGTQRSLRNTLKRIPRI